MCWAGVEKGESPKRPIPSNISTTHDMSAIVERTLVTLYDPAALQENRKDSSYLYRQTTNSAENWFEVA